jgi:hypothetical protein
MLRKLSKEVRECYARAEDCTRKAAEAIAEERREDYLRLQQSWLNLALSYDFAEGLRDLRLRDFSKDSRDEPNFTATTSLGTRR